MFLDINKRYCQKERDDILGKVNGAMPGTPSKSRPPAANGPAVTPAKAVDKEARQKGKINLVHRLCLYLDGENGTVRKKFFPMTDEATAMWEQNSTKSNQTDALTNLICT